MMKRLIVFVLGFTIGFWNISVWAESGLIRLVKKIQPSVAMVVTYDIDGEVSGIGSGFIVAPGGVMITNLHVLKDAYTADVKMYDGKRYPIKAVIAQDRAADVIKVIVDSGQTQLPHVNVSSQMPAIAERIVVVGSPLGLEQTVSEGIVSAIRDMPNIGSFFQISAPISPGSSGSPVMNMKGEVVGIATFQTSVGQNLNFAISGKSIMGLVEKGAPMSVSEWTYSLSKDKPRMAAELCRKGFEFSIQGEDKKALQYYQEATEKDPTDTMAWYGLGYCYVGLDKTEQAIDAYKQAVRNNPTDAMAHFNLAQYFNKIGRDQEAIDAYKEVIRLNPKFGDAYFNLGRTYAENGMLEEGRSALFHLTRIEPDNAPAFFLLGITYEHLGRNEDALAAQKEVIRLNPSFAPAHYRMGQVLGKMGNAEDAVAAYKQTLRVDPDYAPAHFKVGQIYLLNGNKTAALAEYKILKDLDETLANALFDLIYQ